MAFGELLPDCLVCPSFGVTDAIFQASVSPSVDSRDVYQFRWDHREGPRALGTAVVIILQQVLGT